MRTNSSKDSEAAEDYSSTVVAPLRLRVAEYVNPLLEKSVNVDGLKGMLPMLLMALMQNVNVPLLLATVGLDVDNIKKLMELSSDFIKNGMDNND